MIDDFLIRRLWVTGDVGYCFVPSVGSSAGLFGARWISLTFDWVSAKVKVILVYAYNIAQDKMLPWEKLRPMLSFDGAITVLGDFNEITKLKERRNEGSFTISMKQFVDFIN